MTIDWWAQVSEWAHDHAVYTKDRPDTVEVVALQDFLDELLVAEAAPPLNEGGPRPPEETSS